MEHRDASALEAGLDRVRAAPADVGTVELLVRRPTVDARELLEEARLDPTLGLVGDGWSTRPSTSSPDGGPHPDRQLTVMGARVVDLLAGSRDRWALAGDQVYVDLDLSVASLPPGSRLALGTAVIEVTDAAHLGCAKFRQRFGAEALRFVNSPTGRALRLRGLNARVVEAGTVRPGDAARRLDP